MGASHGGSQVRIGKGGAAEVARFFDIVGIDEGTCGRRRLRLVALGREIAV